MELFAWQDISLHIWTQGSQHELFLLSVCSWGTFWSWTLDRGGGSVRELCLKGICLDVAQDIATPEIYEPVLLQSSLNINSIQSKLGRIRHGTTRNKDLSKYWLRKKNQRTAHFLGFGKCYKKVHFLYLGSSSCRPLKFYFELHFLKVLYFVLMFFSYHCVFIKDRLTVLQIEVELRMNRKDRSKDLRKEGFITNQRRSVPFVWPHCPRETMFQLGHSSSGGTCVEENSVLHQQLSHLLT